MTRAERRQAPRINTILIFNFRHLREDELEFALKHVSNFSSAKLPPFPQTSTRQIPTNINISANGMAFATQEHFSTGDMLAITIQLSHSSPPVRVIARVVDFIEDPEGTTGYVRVAFKEIAQYNRLRLVNFIVSKFERERRASI